MAQGKNVSRFEEARMLVGTNEQGTNRVDKERVCMRERLGGKGALFLFMQRCI